MNGRYSRIIVMLLVAASIAMYVPRVIVFATEPPPVWPSRGEKQLVSWLQRNDRSAILLTTNAQALAVVSDAYFRWTTCEQSPAEIARVLQLVRTDYVLVYEEEKRCSFARGLDARANPLMSFGDAPNRIVLLKVAR
jgi:hypothetical protein